MTAMHKCYNGSELEEILFTGAVVKGSVEGQTLYIRGDFIA